MLFLRKPPAKRDVIDVEDASIAGNVTAAADAAIEATATVKSGTGLLARLAAKLRRRAPQPSAPDAGTEAEEEPGAREPDRPALRRRTEHSNKHPLPIRVLVGFLPEVTERDALQFARGLAEKYCENLAIAYVDVARFGTGWAYEVQEGGSGKAYLPAIIAHFQAQGAHEQVSPVAVVLRTATRRVRIERTRDGLSATQLPESAQDPVDEWLQPLRKMTPVISTMLPLLVVGGAFAATGALAFGVANLARVQPYLPPPPPKVERVDASNFPHAQWSRLLNLAADDYVTALVYDNGRWHVRTRLGKSPMPAPAAVGSGPQIPSPQSTGR